MAKPRRYKRQDLAYQLNKSNFKPSQTADHHDLVQDSPQIQLNGSEYDLEGDGTNRSSFNIREHDNVQSFYTNKSSVVDSPYQKFKENFAGKY